MHDDKLSGTAMQSPLLVVRLYFLRHLFQTGSRKILGGGPVDRLYGSEFRSRGGQLTGNQEYKAKNVRSKSLQKEIFRVCIGNKIAAHSYIHYSKVDLLGVSSRRSVAQIARNNMDKKCSSLLISCPHDGRARSTEAAVELSG